MSKKFEAKITGGSNTFELARALATINDAKPEPAHVEIKSPREVTDKFNSAGDVKIDLYLLPTGIEYEDGTRTGVNLQGVIGKNTSVKEFRGRPFKAYYNPLSMKKKNCGWIEIVMN